MRNLVIAAGFLSALSSTAAIAQDNPGFNWTGAYIGVQTGGAFSQPGFSGDPGGLGNDPFGDTGFAGGVYAGHDWQAGNFVYGGLLNFDYLGVQAQYGESAFDGKSNAYAYDIDWVAAARARGGFLVNDQLLLYGSAGVAVTRAEVSSGQSGFGFPPEARVVAPGDRSVSVDKTLLGGAVGAGAEYAFTQNLSLKADYTHYFFGGVDVGGSNGNEIPIDDTQAVTFKPRFGTLTLGLSYRF